MKEALKVNFSGICRNNRSWEFPLSQCGWWHHQQAAAPRSDHAGTWSVGRVQPLLHWPGSLRSSSFKRMGMRYWALSRSCPSVCLCPPGHWPLSTEQFIPIMSGGRIRRNSNNFKAWIDRLWRPFWVFFYFCGVLFWDYFWFCFLGFFCGCFVLIFVFVFVFPNEITSL